MEFERPETMLAARMVNQEEIEMPGLNAESSFSATGLVYVPKARNSERGLAQYLCRKRYVFMAM